MSQFYLDTWTGTGTDNNPFVPVGTAGISGWSVIDLRPDSTVSTGRCILALPDGSADPVGAIQIGTNLDTVLTNTQTTSINTALGSSLPNGLTRRQAIQNLLLNPPVGKWNTLVNTRFPDNTFRTQIFLAGQTILDNPVIQGGAGPFTESFNKADGPGYGPDLSWVSAGGVSGAEVKNNQATNINGAGSGDSQRAANDASVDDNETRIDAVTMELSTNSRVIACARFQTAQDTCYRVVRQGNTTLGTFSVILQKRIGGGVTVLQTTSNVARANLSTSETVFETCSGSTITGYIDGVQQVQVTDTAITTGTRGGCMIVQNVAESTFGDNFKFGDLGTTGPTSTTGLPVWSTLYPPGEALGLTPTNILYA